MDKRFLTEQLGARFRDAVQLSHKTQKDSHEHARTGEDRAVALAKGLARRDERVRAELDALDGFAPQPLGKGAKATLGALVEIEGEDSGRTLFLAPVGAGLELTGPDGDGFFSVVTPASPIGRAVMGKRVGEYFELTVQGDIQEYRVTWIG